MLEAQPDFDPHSLKHEGAETQRSAHVNDPYVHQEYPKVVYKAEGETRIVNDDDELQKATADGFSETPGAIVAVEPVPVIEPTHVVIDEARE